MVIITYSETSSETLKENLGEAHYSYYFIYVKYLPVLERIGKVIAVSDPSSEVDKIFHANSEDECIFLSFTPPSRTELTLDCPTVCIFAWEFSTVPNEALNGIEENNWTLMLERLGTAVTLSHYAKSVVEKLASSAVKISVIPAAVETIDPAQIPDRLSGHTLNVEAAIYDSKDYDITPENVDDVMFSTRDPMGMQVWDDKPVRVFYGEDNADAMRFLVGFFAPESWGVWTKTDSPWLLLPFKVRGHFILNIELVAYDKNIDRQIDITFGKQTHSIFPSEVSDIYELSFTPEDEADVLMISNIDVQRSEGSTECRPIGLGIQSLEMRRPRTLNKGFPKLAFAGLNRVRAFFGQGSNLVGHARSHPLSLEGITYTSVFNPQDGRKNWEQMITAFCWTFRQQENATLILKMTHNNYLTFLGRLLASYAKMSPFKCRVVAVHGFLTDEQYQTLIQSTHFVVNTSTAEGQCLPLMEFMGQGIPAVAPSHTAMADYIDRDNAFVIDASLYPTNWPQDERKAISTMAYQINWDSLCSAFEDSYHLATHDASGYRDMQINCITAIERCAGTLQVEEKIRQFAGTTAKSAGAL
jgi:hypothetical protein